MCIRDRACAYAEGPVLYQLGDESIRIDEVYFNPPFKDNLYFLHLGKKQDSSLAVAEYKTKSKAQPSLLDLSLIHISEPTRPY